MNPVLLRCVRTGAAIAMALAAIDAVAAADIYKCVDATSHVTYQSSPCKGGAKLDLDAGTFDADAAAQLQTERREFAERERERRLAAERDDARRLARDAADRRAALEIARDVVPDGGCSDCGWGYVLPLPVDGFRPRPQRPPRPPLPPPRPPDTATLPGIPRAQAGLPPLTPLPGLPRS